MATKNQKKKNRFPDALIKEWDKSDGVNFAVALARLTGWLLHIDWWSLSDNEDEEEMISLQVYVGTDGNFIYDYNGKKSIEAYNEYTILPKARKRATSSQGIVLTRFYSEEKLFQLPLRVKPNEELIIKAILAIKNNPKFLGNIPERAAPCYPAHKAGDFNFGHCVPFAEALSVIRNLPSIAIIAKEYLPAFGNSKIGYCHSVVLHNDEYAEDSWGKQPLAKILERFGISKYELSADVQQKTRQTLLQNSKDKYGSAYQEAFELISTYTP